MFDQFIHRWLRVPYTLHTTVRRDAKPKLTVLMIHGIGNSGHAWDNVRDKLPPEVRVVTVDLLGFGRSPHPAWAEYNAKTQARSVLATYLKLRLYGPIVIVGHSLGALVAIEIARRYPLLVKGLLLCSPPLYHLDSEERELLPKPDKVLTSLYKTLKKHPEEFLKFGEIALRYKVVNEAFQVTPENVAMYMATLESAIINQTSMGDIQKLTCPIRILHGVLDPVVVVQNLSRLDKLRSNITLRHVAAGHEVTGLMAKATVEEIKKWL